MSENKNLPLIDGLLAFHRYTSYDAMDAELFIYDFSHNQLQNISKNWSITNTMNAHFSPDGKSITFMAISNNQWDLFLYQLNTTHQPTNLTAGEIHRNEDPKFSHDGHLITYKRDGQIAIYNLQTNQIEVLTDNHSSEYSMPYFSKDDKQIVCSKGAGKNSSIVLIDVLTKKETALYDRQNIAEYYPITYSSDKFYFSATSSETNGVDQLFDGYFSGLRAEKLPFNKPDFDLSDACPIDDNWLILSATKVKNNGYDLYIADRNGTEITSLSDYNSEINSNKYELGASLWTNKK
ncbi:MAG: DPP IV N-terminal domain-containing protein [Bacteroidales bacterium]|nr:DPP IV N-terminal domain-containing protein [Bacteroidales bacterium]